MPVPIRFKSQGLAILLLGIAVQVAPVVADSSLSRYTRDDYQLAAWTVGSAATSATSAAYQLRGTVAQRSPIGASGNAEYLLQAGFWPIALEARHPTPAPDVLPPTETRLYPVAPNPFNPSTRLDFDLADPGRASLVVYDLRGRLVRRLVDGFLAAGSHHVVWDGRDDEGRALASGPYFCRMHAAGCRAVVKMVLVK